MDGLAQGIEALGEVAEYLTAEELPDTLARIRALKDKMIDLDDAITARAILLAGEEKRLEGSRFVLTVTSATREGIDVRKLRAELPEVASRYTYATNYLSVRLRAAA